MEREIRTESLAKIKAEINPDEEILDLREQVKILNNKLSDYKRKHGTLKTLFRDLGEAVEAMDAKPIQYKPPKDSKPSNPVCPVIQISDMHKGMVQIADEIEGFNAFDPDICDARCMYYVKQVLEWIQIHRSNFKIDEARIIVTGDMISGDIHRELSITNAYPTPVQVVEAAKTLASQILYLAPHFLSVTVDFIVADNHSRLTDRPQAKESGLNSLNYLVGYISKLLLAKQENVTYHLWPMVQKVIKVMNRRYLIMHGHTVRSWSGHPWYGWDRKLGREAVKRMRSNRHSFDVIVAGHFHQPIFAPGWMLCGSVSGTDAYDHENGRWADPSQSAWFVHPKHGEFDRTDFILTGADSEVKQ